VQDESPPKSPLGDFECKARIFRLPAHYCSLLIDLKVWIEPESFLHLFKGGIFLQEILEFIP
jgi:hypothetical protein